MRSYPRLTMFLFTAFLALAFSAFYTVPVFADDGAPPPPPADTGTVETPPVVDVAPPADGSAETAATDTTAVDAADPMPADAGDGTTSTDSLPPLDESSTPAEILAQVPDGTEVVVTDPSGSVVPLASQDAVDAIMTGDPMWCPTGVTPFLVAGRFRTGEGLASTTITISTVLAVVSVTFWLHVVQWF